MALTVKTVEFTPEEIQANLNNISNSLVEIGVKCTDNNMFYLSLIIISNMMARGLNETQIRYNHDIAIQFVKKYLNISLTKGR